MDPRVLGILVLMIQAYLNQPGANPGVAAGGVGRAGLAGLAGAALMRPFTFLVSPFRMVGRGIGWLFGWGNNAANVENPAFAIFEYAVREDRHAALAIMRGQTVRPAEESGLMICYMSKTFYNGLTVCIKIIVTAAGIYIIYRASKYIIVRLYHAVKAESHQAKIEEQKKIENKLRQLESEQSLLKSRSK